MQSHALHDYIKQ